MTSRSSLRIAQLVGLITLGVTALYAMFRYAVAIFNFNIVYLLALLLATATLYYCVITCNRLMRKKPITKFDSGFSVLAAVLAACFIGFIAVGLIKDVLGVYCTGIMGGAMACVAQPVLAVWLWVSLLPQVMSCVGLFALAGIYSHYHRSDS